MRPGLETARRTVEERPVGARFKPKFSRIRSVRPLVQLVTGLVIASPARMIQSIGTGTI